MYVEPIGDYSLGIDAGQCSDGFLQVRSKVFEPAELVAMDATPLTLIENDDSSKGIVFLGAVFTLLGGSAAYDQNQDTILKYTDAGGVAVSTTLANFFNGGADTYTSTLKAITTDHAVTLGAPIVITSSASPYSAAGDRSLRVQFQYRMVSVA
jgi:hypothetical protein